MSAQYASAPDRIAYFEKVWTLVRQIPPGKVSTYGRIAALITPPPGMSVQAYRVRGPRMVGGAMAACPDNVPWQRVINAQGKVSIRAGEGGASQRSLLEGEGVEFDDKDRVDLERFLWDGPPGA
ncbi:MAG: MGMT family protein [Chloroflexota bacterium]|nr:MAG: MGMT family protein [Chloroflexota bacterium]